MSAFECSDEPVEPEAAPDLIVSSVSVSDPTPTAGGFIDVNAAVRNRGDGPATPAPLRFYQSTDSTITTADRELGAVAVAALAASATESGTLNLFVSAPATFYLGACIDSVPDESDTGNNCSDSVQVVAE